MSIRPESGLLIAPRGICLEVKLNLLQFIYTDKEISLTPCMDIKQGRVLIRLYPIYGYWTGQITDKAIPPDTGKGRLLMMPHPW